MEALRAYLKLLKDADKKDAFARRCGTTMGYITKVLSTGEKFGESLCINFERESGGLVRCEDLRDDVDWSYLRGTEPSKSSLLKTSVSRG